MNRITLWLRAITFSHDWEFFFLHSIVIVRVFNMVAIVSRTKPFVLQLIISKPILFSYLVGGLVAIKFIFPYMGFLIIPIDFHIFQRGGPTTNQLLSQHLLISWHKISWYPTFPTSQSSTDPQNSTNFTMHILQRNPTPTMYFLEL